jgi:CRP-like cAMP-binding protein
VDIQRETEALSKVPLFSKLEQSKLKLLAFTSELQTYEDGETVFTEGEAADCTFVIMDGEADIYAKIKTDGGEMVVGTLRANQLLGELGVLTSSPRSATIRAGRSGCDAAIERQAGARSPASRGAAGQIAAVRRRLSTGGARWNF